MLDKITMFKLCRLMSSYDAASGGGSQLRTEAGRSDLGDCHAFCGLALVSGMNY